MISGKTYHLFVIFCLINLSLNASFEEYVEMERQTPEAMFTQHIDDPHTERFPEFSKLMFITPWSKDGIDLSLKYAHKLDYISPCWYDLTFSSDHIIIQNDKLYNPDYISNIKAANPDIKILPRFYIASNQQTLLHTIGSFQSKFKQAINLIIKIVQNHKYEGIVFDTPFNTFMDGQKYAGLRNLILQLVNSIKMNLPKEKLVFFNMANPMNLDLATQRYMILNVDCILIQNYDNNNYFQMIEAGIQWIKNTKIQSKPSFMFLLPFFSRRKGQGVDTKEIMRLYESEGQHMGSAVEKNVCMFFEYKRRIQSFSPCYSYFSKVFERLKEENIMKVGFWEGGNGIQTYYQFL